MGFLSKIGGALEKGLGLRTGATSAARDAKRSGEEQLALEREFGEELKGITQPGIGLGQQATQSLYDYYAGDPATQQQFITQAQQSPMYTSMLGQGEQAIARNASATGGFRGGDIQENLAVNSQNVLNSILGQKLQGLGQISDYGLQSQNIYTGGRGGNIAQMGQTRGGIAQIGIDQAAGKRQLLGDIAGTAGKVVGGFF